MRLAFAGTPEFARVALQALHEAGHTLALVLTQPDRPAGRGLKLQASAVKQYALQHGLPLSQARSLRLDGKFGDDARAAQLALQSAAPELMVVAAYGLILPTWALTLPPRGCINIHGSLLPRWRGAAPIHRAIEAGDSMTGITLMQMDAGLDTGPMLMARSEPIAPTDTTASLHDRLAALGAEMVAQGIADLEQGSLTPQAQPAEGVTYAHKVDKAEGVVDWRLDASLLERKLRAFDPYPGCSACVGGQSLKLWRGRVITSDHAVHASPGERLEGGPGRLVVACGAGALELLEVQAPGGKRLSAAEYLARQSA